MFDAIEAYSRHGDVGVALHIFAFYSTMTTFTPQWRKVIDSRDYVFIMVKYHIPVNNMFGRFTSVTIL